MGTFFPRAIVCKSALALPMLPHALVSSLHQKHHLIYRRWFYPSVTDIVAASPVQILPGQETRITVSLTPEEGFRVSGIVTRGPTVPLLTGRLQDSNGISEGVTIRSSNFEVVDLPSGTYNVVMTGTWYGETAFTVGPSISDLSVGVMPLYPVPLHVQYIFTNPERSGTVNMSESDYRATFVLRSLDVPRTQPSSFLVGPSNGGHSYAFDVFKPGKYTLETSLIDGWYIQSASSGGINVLQDSLTVGKEPTAPIEVVLSNDTATLAGTVQTDHHGVNSVLLMISVRQVLAGIKTSMDGKFQVDNLAPGDYTVFAFDSLEDLEYRNPLALAEYAASSVHLTLTGSQQETISLDLIKREP